MNIGEKLFELRKNKNLSQEDVAEKLNVTRQTVSKWETGQSLPDFDKIIPLCELFEISTDELLRGKKSENLENESTNLEEKNNSEQKEDIKTEENVKSENSMTKDEIRRKAAGEISTSIFIYIAALGVFIAIVDNTNIEPALAVGGLLIACAFATARIIKGCMSMPKQEKEEKIINEKNEILKSIRCIIWCLITALYIVLSFVTMAWHITWVIFIIGAVISEIAKLCFLLKDGENNEK